MFVEVDFSSQEDLCWSGVVIMAVVILLAWCYQPCCVYVDFIYAPLPDGQSILDTTIVIGEVFSDIWEVVY